MQLVYWCHIFYFPQSLREHTEIMNIELFTDSYQDYIPVKLPLDNKKINNILGTSITEKIYCEYLEKLGFKINDNDVLQHMCIFR